jgi:hypothetical protein
MFYCFGFVRLSIYTNLLMWWLCLLVLPCLALWPMIIIGADDAIFLFAIYFFSVLLPRNPVLGEVVSYLLVASVGQTPTLRSACDSLR